MRVVPGYKWTRTLMTILMVSLLAGCEPGDEPVPDPTPKPSAPLPRFGSAVAIESPAGPGAGEPWLSVEPDGRVLMSWLEPSADGQALRFSLLDGDAWSLPRTVTSGVDLFVNWADFPSVSPLPDGSLVARRGRPRSLRTRMARRRSMGS